MKMLERMARAIDPTAWARNRTCGPAKQLAKRVALRKAEAVLAAMREPSEAMCAAGVAKDEELEWLQPERATPQIWQAMIDAAMKEET